MAGDEANPRVEHLGKLKSEEGVALAATILAVEAIAHGQEALEVVRLQRFLVKGERKLLQLVGDVQPEEPAVVVGAVVAEVVENLQLLHQAFDDRTDLLQLLLLAAHFQLLLRQQKSEAQEASARRGVISFLNVGGISGEPSEEGQPMLQASHVLGDTSPKSR